MRPEEFSDGVRELRRACDLSDVPRQEVLLVWYSYLRHIETREWKSIVRRMVRTERDGFPRNLVAAVETYAEPKRERPACFTDIELSEEDREAAREFFSQLSSIGLMPHERDGGGA